MGNEENWSNRWANIPVRPETKARLDSLVKFKQTYDQLLNHILDVLELKKVDKLLEEKIKK